MKRPEEILEDCGLDVEKFKHENEYSYKNVVSAMKIFAKQHHKSEKELLIGLLVMLEKEGNNKFVSKEYIVTHYLANLKSKQINHMK